MDGGKFPHAPESINQRERRLVNPYVDSVDHSRPIEIAQFELETDPYRNLLPGMSNVNAAKVVGGGLRAGRSGNRVLLVVSLLLVAVLILPAFMAAIAQLFQ
jgi:hypothetical protein